MSNCFLFRMVNYQTEYTPLGMRSELTFQNQRKTMTVEINTVLVPPREMMERNDITMDQIKALVETEDKS